MLIMIKNGSRAGHESVVFPYSKLKHAIALCLEREGYVGAVSKKVKKNVPSIEVGLLYNGEKPRVSEVKRLSKPSRRVYQSVKDMRPTRQGTGTIVYSTPKGIMTDKQARKEHVGGEALFSIW